MLVLAGGASVAVVEALSRVSTAYRSSLLGALEASAAAQHAGAFYLPLLGAMPFTA